MQRESVTKSQRHYQLVVGVFVGVFAGLVLGCAPPATVVTTPATPPATAIASSSSSSGLRFAATQQRYADNANLTQACQAELGSGYRVADWNDISSYVQGLNGAGTDADQRSRLATFFGEVAMGPYDTSITHEARDANGERVLYKGQAQDGGRYYFLVRHDGMVDGDFLIVAELGNHSIDLGSWYGYRQRVLCTRLGT